MEANFERLRMALLCQGEPDHVPFVDVGVYQGHKARVIGRPLQGLPDEIEFARRIGYDFVPIEIGLQRTPIVRGAMQSKHYVVNGDSVSDETNPAETVERRWAAATTGIITNEADFEAFPWPDPETFDDSAFALADQIMPRNMKVICHIGKIFNPVWWLMGFEDFCMALVDNPGLVERMFEKVGSIQFGVLERVLEHRCVGAYWHSDDVAFATSLMVSPDVLRCYAFPWFRRLVELAHDRGVPAVYHSDGKLDLILEDIIDIGFNGLNPVEPKAMDIVELKGRVQGRLCLLGNIDLNYTLTCGTPQEVDEEVKARIRALAPGGGYCLSSANSIPDYVPFENYLAMREAWLKYGSYPIRCDYA